METAYFSVQNIPAVLYGGSADKIWLFVHGKCGCKEDTEEFAKLICPNGWQVLSIDMPEHGVRQGDMDKLVPWQVVPELQSVMAYVRKNWEQVGLRANSIGAWFSLLAFRDTPPERSLFVSPLLDMAELDAEYDDLGQCNRGGIEGPAGDRPLQWYFNLKQRLRRLREREPEAAFFSIFLASW